MGPGPARCAALALAAALTLAACSSGRSATSTTTAAAAAAATTTASGPTATTSTTVAGQQAGVIVGPEQVPIPDGPPLGPVKSDLYGEPIDGIKCETSEQVAYHIHSHLSVFVAGRPRQVPYAIGIAPPIHVSPSSAGGFVDSGSCFYWLHTHAADGVIHVESPDQTATYTLGQFFDVWGQNLAPGQVGPASGQLTVFVDGQPYTGNPRDIVLATHREIQLDVGTAVPPKTTAWPSGL